MSVITDRWHRLHDHRPGTQGADLSHPLHDPDLEAHFAERGWQSKYEVLADLHRGAEFTFLEQPRDGRYGTAVPAMVASKFVDGDDFLLLVGDDLLLRPDGGSDLADLVAAREHAGAPAAIAAATVAGADAHRYGILATRHDAHGNQLLAAIVEKPAHHPDPVAHINISRALLPGDFVDYLDALKCAVNGEYQATDAIAAYARDHDVLVHPVTGQYHDCGNTAGWLAANLAAAQARGILLPFASGDR
ncbi:sugar phosphate nucleotidyltransferase [Streptosporangium roseum]|uniref:sugar phosphate nucleotidyltransferase n=1 Tax=Streptosporangium roseum TaxID=2001 RepID=UPI0004CCC512|nr:sugar phosphate nucleotidyltransferase [Streptosporangium roseum]